MDEAQRQEKLQAITGDLMASLRVDAATAELEYPQQVFVLLAKK
jgi:hypothetical protein